VKENTNTTLSDSVLQGRQQQQRMQQKLEVYNEILRRLQESNHEEANLPGFDDQLWTHFNSLPTRYVCVCVCVCFSTCTCIYTIYVYVCDLVLPLRYVRKWKFWVFFLIWIISFFFVFLFLSFGGQFWFWNLLWCRYALDVNVERAEDVLTHKRLLRLAHDPANRPAIEIRLVQVTSIYWLVMFFILPMLLDTKLWRFDYE
jgi:hypothetical protein